MLIHRRFCLFLFLIILSVLSYTSCSSPVYFSISDYGAVPNDPSLTASRANSKAFQSACAAAMLHRSSSPLSSSNRFLSGPDFSVSFLSTLSPTSAPPNHPVVLIPANTTFYFFFTPVSDLHSIDFQFDGQVLVYNLNLTDWEALKVPQWYGVFDITNSTDIAIYSTNNPALQNVNIDGQGYPWWKYVFHTGLDYRPHLFYFSQVAQINLHSLYLRDSPMFHVYFNDCINVWVQNMKIRVNWEGRDQAIQEYRNALTHPLASDGESSIAPEFLWNAPEFPLNTDGIDPAATNVLLEQLDIENFDDVVAVKPCNSAMKYCHCSSNMLIRNSKAAYGLGMTIGSVPPSVNHNCVQNITFENIEMVNPIKAVYIKSNPGKVGTGFISDIVYRNITARDAVWYPVWIGPQQQHQPGNGTNTGCSFFYPLQRQCPTDPLVTIQNIELTSVQFHNGIATLPGVILCDPTNPCNGFQWNNVSNTAKLWWVEKSYDCHNTNGIQSSVKPPISCWPTEQQQIDQQLERIQYN